MGFWRKEFWVLFFQQVFLTFLEWSCFIILNEFMTSPVKRKHIQILKHFYRRKKIDVKRDECVVNAKWTLDFEKNVCINDWNNTNERQIFGHWRNYVQYVFFFFLSFFLSFFLELWTRVLKLIRSFFIAHCSVRMECQ